MDKPHCETRKLLLERRPVVIFEAAYPHWEIKVAEGSLFIVHTSGQLIFHSLQVPFAWSNVYCFQYLDVDAGLELLHALVGWGPVELGRWRYGHLV